MKKLFIIILAIVLLSSCTQKEDSPKQKTTISEKDFIGTFIGERKDVKYKVTVDEKTLAIAPDGVWGEYQYDKRTDTIFTTIDTIDDDGNQSSEVFDLTFISGDFYLTMYAGTDRQFQIKVSKE